MTKAHLPGTLTTKEAGKRLGRSSNWVRRRCVAGRLPAELTPGGHWRISEASFAAFHESMRVGRRKQAEAPAGPSATPAEVAARIQGLGLRCSDDTVRRMCEQKVFPGCVKLSTGWRIPTGDVDAYVEALRRS